MANKQFKIKFPEGFIDSVNKRHNGTPHTHQEIARVFYVMTKIYNRNKEIRVKEKHLLFVEWKEKEIEKHFQSPIWYNANRRLDKYREIIKETHKEMFYLLTRFDGNSGEPFNQFDSISEEEIYEDFKIKYIDE